MMNCEKSPRIKISNCFKKPITLWLEPWGEDYGMLADDEFEIIAVEANENVYFHIVLTDGISVYVEGDPNAYAHIYFKGNRLECRYNRIDG